MKSVEGIIKWVSSLFFGATVLLWWGYVNPHILSFQEQYQLFLCTGDYFMERIAVPGGLADYLGEFIAQFNYYPWIGAVLLCVLFLAIQVLVWYLGEQKNIRLYAASFLPSIILLAFMEDENILTSYVVAGTLSLAVAALAKWIGNKSVMDFTDLLIVPVLYWLLGPMVWMYVIARSLQYTRKWWGAIVAVDLLGVQLLLASMLLQQWPLMNSFLGLTYYRIPYMLPDTLWMWPLVVCFFIGITYLPIFWKVLSDKVAGLIALFVVFLVGWFLVTYSYDEDKSEIIRQDYLVRSEKWDEIISRAEHYQVHDPFSSQSVNLALAMKRQLAARMFSFYQSGEEALIMPMVRDMITDFPSAEAFFRIGMINSAQRYMSDIQESILNYRKSGRCTRRIVECLIINGKYDLAHKHIDLLKKSLFYSSWAKDAEKYLGQEAWIESHPVWSKLRKYRYNNDFLYNYGEREKMFGLLFINNPDNKMALDYLMGQLLLNGNIQDFMQYMSWVQQYGGYNDMPVGYQDAVKCIQNNGDVPGSPYAAYVKRMTSGNVQKMEENDTAH